MLNVWNMTMASCPSCPSYVSLLYVPPVSLLYASPICPSYVSLLYVPHVPPIYPFYVSLL